MEKEHTYTCGGCGCKIHNNDYHFVMPCEGEGWDDEDGNFDEYDCCLKCYEKVQDKRRKMGDFK